MSAVRSFRCNLAVAGVLALAACEPTTNLPLRGEVINLPLSVEQLVCHVRQVSASQGLSFHYGTSDQSFGKMATFRLIGDGYEITLVNAEKPFEYDLRVYDASSETADNRPVLAYSRFKRALLEPPSGECAR